MRTRRVPSERGAALVEMALATPLLVVLIVFAVDFARVFYLGMELTNAARAGAQHGSRTAIGFDATDVRNVTLAASPQISPFTVTTPTQECFCTTLTGASTLHACGSTCSVSGEILTAFVTVSVSKTFDPIMSFAGVPGSMTVSRSVTMRAQ